MGALRIVVLGLSITSSWGNGHATTFRALLRALAARGHDLLFLERDAPWYARHRDLPAPPFCRTHLYPDPDALRRRFSAAVRDAELVVVGSYVPDGIAVIDWVQRTARGLVAFYDIDTPVTLRALERDGCAYLAAAQVPRFDLYLSFSSGPVLERLERRFGAARARALPCSVDARAHAAPPVARDLDLGYLGTFAPDRQPALERLLLAPARRWPAGRFAVAGPQYPETVAWPAAVERHEHLPPAAHPRFYARQRFTLNLTRADMVAAGFSPSVRLFEAAACGTPVLSDAWPGLEIFFAPGREILVPRDADEVLALLRDLPESRRRAIGAAARARVLAEHSAERRARQLEEAVEEARTGRSAAAAAGSASGA